MRDCNGREEHFFRLERGNSINRIANRYRYIELLFNALIEMYFIRNKHYSYFVFAGARVVDVPGYTLPYR